MAKENKLPIIEQCRQKAMDLLSIRLHSVFELRKKLQKKFEAKEINIVIHDLIEYKLLSDFEFSKSYLEWRSINRGLYKIKQELKRRGIDQETMQKAIEDWQENNPQEDQEEILLDIASRKWNSIRDKSDIMKAKAKLARFLAGRGFSVENIYFVLNNDICKKETD